MSLLHAPSYTSNVLPLFPLSPPPYISLVTPTTHFVVLVYESCLNDNDAHAIRYYVDNEDELKHFMFNLQCESIDRTGALYPHEILIYEESIDPLDQ